ncbi:MAG: SOS response-associated peptidase [Deltaproteobacteria bacterium]|nr:MAG: SOS response-associated peptidase [Deltaproteobacteria bacterium]
MCGRFTLTSTPESLAERFGLDAPPSLAPRYNIAPGQEVLAIRAHGEGRRAALLRWGLVPAWSDRAAASAGPPLINARAETAAQRAAFRDAFRARRCIVPASGFYEWANRGDFRQPYWIAPSDGAPWGIAGLWERWTAPDGAPLESCALLTTAANARVAELHDRMPAILAPDAYAIWLDPARDAAALAGLLAPLAFDALLVRPVGTRVNRVENDDPALLDAVPEPPRQPSLF